MKLKEGDVVQINPEYKNQMFAGCMAVISEVSDKRIMAYVQSLGSNEEIGGQAYIFIQPSDCERVGKAIWMAR